MNAQTPDISLLSQFQTIEHSVTTLLSRVKQLRAENLQIAQREQHLIAECERLRHANQHASEQLEALLKQLKSKVE